MKTQQFLQFLTQQLTYWRRQYKALRRKGKLFERSEVPVAKVIERNFKRHLSGMYLSIYQKPVVKADTENEE